MKRHNTTINELLKKKFVASNWPHINYIKSKRMKHHNIINDIESDYFMEPCNGWDPPGRITKVG